MSDCRFGVSPVNYPDPDPAKTKALIRLHMTSDTFSHGPAQVKVLTSEMVCL